MIGVSLRRLRQRLAAEDGMTLSELVVVLAILGTVIAAAAQIFVSALHSETDQTNRVTAQNDARVALSELRTEIHCASGVSSSSSSSVTITLPSYCPSAVSTTLSASVTLPAATIGVASTTKFNTGTNTISFGSSGTVTCTGKTTTSFTGCSGGTSGTYSSGSTVTTPVTWCVTGSAIPYTLSRYVGSSCSGSTGVAWVSTLRSSSVFSYNRSSLLSAPTLSAASTGGTLKSGTYTYDVTALLSTGLEVSGGTATISVPSGSTNKVTITWNAYTPSSGSVSSYRIYGRDNGSTSSSGLLLLATVASTGTPSYSYVDDGSASLSGVTTGPPLATLSVSFVTDKTTSSTSEQFSVSDDIVLRNSGRF